MIEAFKNYIETSGLFSPDDKILLAVSGGIDSVAMVHLFHRATIKFGIAHSNFNLRGNESDEDEAFVKKLAHENNVPFFVKKFDTQKYASQNKISIQMAARELRYTWFEEIRVKHHFDFVATAHHLDDQAETFFINLIRGTGISGLHGILPKQGSVIRPLMFTTRDEIGFFAEAEKLIWREDSSNASRKYLRNKLRHDVLAQLGQINQNFSRSLNQTISHIRDVEQIYNSHLSGVSYDLIQQTPDGDIISIDWLLEYQPLDTYLFELLKRYGFSFSVVKKIVSSLQTSSGKTFFSPTHQLLRDRENLVIQSLKEIEEQKEQPDIFSIEQDVTQLCCPVELTFERTADLKNLPLGIENIACFDADKLQFPLHLRHWKAGDWFMPLGLKGRKKLSDFFIDSKIALAEKNKKWLLISGNDIVWILGMRIDNRFCITSKTKNALIISIKTSEDTKTCCCFC